MLQRNFQAVAYLLVIAGCALLLSGCGPAPTPAPSTPSPSTPAPRPPAPKTPAPATPRPTPTPTPSPVDPCDQYKNQTKPTLSGDNAMSLNGQKWPDACWNEESAHFFVIGDWGGLCNLGGDNLCKPNVSESGGRGAQKGLPGEPVSFSNRPAAGPPSQYSIVDVQAQQLVRNRMYDITAELNKNNTPPRFIVNVGDNFYPGGIDLHCGNDKQGPGNKADQFEQIWNKFYDPKKLNNMEWWGVLGNHDYGGACYIKGWDAQIKYTWQNPRWVMPGQFWKRRVHFKGFRADFFMVDQNYYDSINIGSGTHSPCTPGQSPGPLCDAGKLPPKDGTDAGSCPVTGPPSTAGCQAWFADLWEQNRKWLEVEIPKSNKDGVEWQILVTHYPPIYNVPGIEWSSWMDKQGVDLSITGHDHRQEVHYKDNYSGRDWGDTAFVISGGGGGISATPSTLGSINTGEDDAYGFMDMEITKDNIKITAYSHGGLKGLKVIRSITNVKRNDKMTQMTDQDRVVV